MKKVLTEVRIIFSLCAAATLYILCRNDPSVLTKPREVWDSSVRGFCYVCFISASGKTLLPFSCIEHCFLSTGTGSLLIWELRLGAQSATESPIKKAAS